MYSSVKCIELFEYSLFIVSYCAYRAASVFTQCGRLGSNAKQVQRKKFEVDEKIGAQNFALIHGIG